MSHILNTLLPVFLVIGLAYLLGRRGSLSRGFLSELNWLIYWVSLPALIVYSLATAHSFPEDTLPIIAIFTIATVLLIFLCIPVCHWLQISRERVGTFIQASFRGNLAYTGLPILIFAMHGEPREVVSAIVAQTMFVLAPAMLLYNGAAVFVLVGSKKGFSRENLGSIVSKVATNPLILASLLGVILYLAPFKLPTMAINLLDLLGQMAAPAALFCVGGAMATVSMEGRYRSALIASCLKCFVLPLVTFALALFFDLEANARLVLLVLSACPTAVASYIMAKELDGDEALAAGSIILSTLLCIPVISLIIGFY